MNVPLKIANLFISCFLIRKIICNMRWFSVFFSLKNSWNNMSDKIKIIFHWPCLQLSSKHHHHETDMIQVSCVLGEATQQNNETKHPHSASSVLLHHLFAVSQTLAPSSEFAVTVLLSFITNNKNWNSFWYCWIKNKNNTKRVAQQAILFFLNAPVEQQNPKIP